MILIGGQKLCNVKCGLKCYFVGAIELSILNMCKKERQSTDEVYTLVFVPCSELPNRTPCCLDPFIKPIIDELKQLFIKGNVLSFQEQMVSPLPFLFGVYRKKIMNKSGTYKI